jgi:hypothetical protein
MPFISHWPLLFLRSSLHRGGEMSRLFLISVLLFVAVVFPLFAFAADPVVVPAKRNGAEYFYLFSNSSGRMHAFPSNIASVACSSLGGRWWTAAEGGAKSDFCNYPPERYSPAVLEPHRCDSENYSQYPGGKEVCEPKYSCPPDDHPFYTVLTDENGQQPVPDGHYCKKPDCSGLSGAVEYGTYIPMGFNGTDTFGCSNECQVKTQSISTTVNGKGPWATYVYTGEACYTVSNPNGNGTSGATGTEGNGTSGATGTGGGSGGSSGGGSGTGGGSGGSSGGGSGTGSGDGECTGDNCSDDPVSAFCKANPTALACVQLGDPTSSQVIENENINVTFSGSSWGAENAACPAPVHIRDDIYFSYQPACDFFVGVRPVIIAAAFVIAALIVIGAGKRDD